MQVERASSIPGTFLVDAAGGGLDLNASIFLDKMNVTTVKVW